MMTDIQAHLDWFEDFVAQHRQAAPLQSEHIDLKRDHTLRVLDEARRISLEQDPDPPLHTLVELGALYHDIGRFPQLVRFGTFQDAESVNHGLLGFKTLRDLAVLEGFSRQDRRTVLQAVNLHNRASVLNGLPHDLDLVLRVIRDADKLDVISVLLSRFDPDQSEDGVVTLGLRHDPGRYSSEAMNQALQGSMVRYEGMVWVNDFRLLLCSWVYDLNFELSRTLFLERGYVQELIRGLPAARDVSRLEARLMTELESGAKQAFQG
jgi:hypothetical protein